MSFNVGDTVVMKSGINEHPRFNPIGMTGTVRGFTNEGRIPRYIVEFPDFQFGHDCNGRVPGRHGWFCREADLVLVNKDYSQIPRKGITNFWKRIT